MPAYLGIKSSSVPPVFLMLTGVNLVIATIVKTVLLSVGAECIITSGCEGKHSRTSAHYYMMALDFRISWKPHQETKVRAALKAKLPADYRFFRESDHLHVEKFQGRYPWVRG